MAYNPLIDLRLESRNPGEVPKLKIFGEQDEGPVTPAVEQPTFNMTQPQANIPSIVDQAIATGANPVAPINTAPAVNEAPAAAPLSGFPLPNVSNKMQDTTQTTTVFGQPVSKEAQKALDDANKKAEDAITAAKIAGEAKATEEAAFAGRQKALLEQQIKDDAALKTKQDDEYFLTTAERDAAVKSASEAKVDPNRFFKSKGTWAQLGAALAIGLGAYAASQTKGPNYALEIINSAIDRDIEAQKTDIAQKWKGVDQKTNALSELTKRFGDERLAASTLKEQQYAALQADLANKLGNAKNLELKAKIGDMQAQLAQKQAEQKLQTEALAKDKVQKTVTSEAIRTDTVGQSKTMTDALKSWKDDAMVKDAEDKEVTANNMRELLVSVKSGNPADQNAIETMVARAAAGPGILTLEERQSLGLDRVKTDAWLSTMKRYFDEGLSDKQTKTIEGIINRLDKQANRNYAAAAKTAIPRMVAMGVDPRLVIGAERIQKMTGGDKKKEAAPQGYVPRK